MIEETLHLFGKTNLGADVIKGRRADNGEADKKDIGLGV